MAEPERDGEEILSINAASRRAGVSRAALYKAIDRGALESTGTQPANVTVAALEEWLAARSSHQGSRPARLRAVDGSRGEPPPTTGGQLDDRQAAPSADSQSADSQSAGTQAGDTLAWQVVAAQQETIVAQTRIISEQLGVLAEQSATIAAIVSDLLKRDR